MNIPNYLRPNEEDYKLIKKHFGKNGEYSSFKETKKEFLAQDLIVIRAFVKNELAGILCLSPYNNEEDWCVCWFCIKEKFRNKKLNHTININTFPMYDRISNTLAKYCIFFLDNNSKNIKSIYCYIRWNNPASFKIFLNLKFKIKGYEILEESGIPSYYLELNKNEMD